MKELLVVFSAVVMFVGCGLTDNADVSGPESAVRCQDTKQGDSTTVVRCGDESGPVIPAVPE